MRDYSFGNTSISLTKQQLLLQAVIFLTIAFPLVIIAYQGVPFLMTPAIFRAFFVALILLFFTWLLLRREARSLSEYGLSISARALKHLVVGLGAGAGLFLIAALILRFVLPFEWTLNSFVTPQVVVMALLFHLLTNFCEELAWRAHAFVCLLRALGHWQAQFIVALVAAIFHVLSGWSWQVALISTTAGSLLFALTFLRWRSVPAAVGVHAAWNWTRDLILSPGAPTAILEASGTGQWSAVEWQLAQVIFVVVILVACLFLYWSYNRGRWTY